ncbi:MAG: hypothetical protein GX363_00680 [Clostridiales bacterium]|jgi:hypothetical protein|nr:hypothetical protein [Clostridiales bacterium]
MFGMKEKERYRGGVFLTRAKNSLEADILESKLRSEGIPVVRRYVGPSNAMEIIMGSNMTHPIDLYVPEETIEDAKNIIIAVPIISDDFAEEE